MDAKSASRLAEIRSQYFLNDSSHLPLRAKVLAAEEPYGLRNGISYESLKYDGNAVIFEISDKTTGEKLGLDRNSDTWFYEKWWTGSILKIWKHLEHNWGEITQLDGTATTTEKWNFLPDEESYEYLRIEPNNEAGTKVGRKPDIEWKEVWWKKLNEEFLEKYWKSSESLWGEKQGRHLERTWGEEWYARGAEKETKTWNETEGKRWGHVSGEKPGQSWNENWEIQGARKFNDKWWEEENRSWGIKTLVDGDHQINEEWEKSGDIHKIRKTIDDGKGMKTQLTEGFGPNYRFRDEYVDKVGINEKFTVKEGESDKGKWRSEITQTSETHQAHNIGSDENGEWEETWYEKGGRKWAKKRGKTFLGGVWDEDWEEEGGHKKCHKHGTNDINEWWEEWEETDTWKRCKKEQRFPDKICIQQWEENIHENVKHSVGEFLENDVVVKSWDETTELHTLSVQG